MRGLQSGAYYHIYNHANGDDNLFREQRNYTFFIEKYHQHIDPIAETIAWCLIPDHFHLLVRIKDVETLQQDFLKFQTLENLKEEEKTIKRSYLLSKQFSNFFSSYSQSFNKVYNRRGSLFLKNFKRKEIIRNEYLKNLILYIHLNPVKHGFISNVDDWNWSSCQSFYEDKQPLAYELFGGKEAYHQAHFDKQKYFQEYIQMETEILNT